MTYQNPVVYFNRNEISHTYFGISNGDLFNRMPGDTRKRLITFVDMQKCQESDHPNLVNRAGYFNPHKS